MTFNGRAPFYNLFIEQTSYIRWWLWATDVLHRKRVCFVQIALIFILVSVYSGYCRILCLVCTYKLLIALSFSPVVCSLHTHTCTPFYRHFSGECGLVSCPLEFPSLVVLHLRRHDPTNFSWLFLQSSFAISIVSVAVMDHRNLSYIIVDIQWLGFVSLGPFHCA